MTKPQLKRIKAQNRDLEKLLKATEKSLGRDAITGGGDRHYKVQTPNGLVILSSSPSDTHAIKNARARLRRYGVQFD